MNASRRKAVPKPGTLVFQALVSLGLAGYMLYRSVPELDFSSGMEIRELIVPFLGILILVFAVLAVVKVPLALELDREGVLTTGFVVGMRSTTDMDDGRMNFIVYSYLDGQEAQQKVGAREFRRLSPGAPVEVRYLARDPKYSRLEL